jgi:hypothetical protein
LYQSELQTILHTFYKTKGGLHKFAFLSCLLLNVSSLVSWSGFSGKWFDRQ